MSGTALPPRPAVAPRFDNGYEVRIGADMASPGWAFASYATGELCGTLPGLTGKQIYRAISEVTELMRVVAKLPATGCG